MTMERGIITITENGAVTMPTAPVWMTQQEMSDAFNVFGCHIRKAVHAIYKNGELLESETKRYIKQDNGINYDHEQQTARQPFLFALPVAWKESGKLSRPQTACKATSYAVWG